MIKKLFSLLAASAVLCGFGDTIAERAASLPSGAWFAAPLTGSASDIVTKGAVAGDIAYMGTGNSTLSSSDESVAGVSFVQKNAGVSASAVHVTSWKTDGGDCGVEGLYGSALMSHYWSTNLGAGDETFTVEVPAAGSYLLQFVVHNQGFVGKAVTLTEVNGEPLSAEERPSIVMGAADSSETWYFGGTFVFAFEMAQAGQFQFTLNYGGLRMYNMIQLRDVTQREVSAPTITSVSAQALASGTTVTLAGVKIGTDQQGIKATDYEVWFASAEQGGPLPAASKVLEHQSAETCSFPVMGLEAGKVYEYSLFVRNSGGVDSHASVGVIDRRPVADRARTMSVGAWLASPLTGSPDDFVSYGSPVRTTKQTEMVYAKGTGGDGSVNNMTFSDSRDGIAGVVSVDPSRSFWQVGDGAGNCGLDNFYGNTILNKFFKPGYANSQATFTVEIPSAGTYVLQFMFHFKNNDSYKIYPVDSPATYVRYSSADASGDWYYGGTLVHKYNAAGPEQLVIHLQYESELLYNMFQLRQVPYEEEPTGDVVEPAVGSVSAAVYGTSVMFSLDDAVVGTDAEGHAAKTYDLYIDRGDGSAVKVLEGLKDGSCKFYDAGLASGSYAYVFTVSNDLGVVSAAKEVCFEVSAGIMTISDLAASLKPGLWLALPMTGDAADIVTDGVLATNANGQAMAYLQTGDKSKALTDASLNCVPFIESTDGFIGVVDADHAYTTRRNVGGGAGTSGMAGVVYGDVLLDKIFKASWGTPGPVTFTVDVPAKGTYLLQMVCHYQGDYDGKWITLLDGAGEPTEHKIRPASDVASGWYYGGTFVHVFTVEEAGPYVFRLFFDHEVEYNMVQLRQVRRDDGLIIYVR